MRILIVRLSALGDIVHALPVLAALRDHRPDVEVDWLVDARYAGIFEHVEGIRRRIVVRAPAAAAAPGSVSFAGTRGLVGAVRDLRAQQYDVALDLQGLIKSAALAGLAGAKRVVGFPAPHLREPYAAWFYDETADVPEGAHIIRKNLSVLPAIGIDGSRVRFPIRVPASRVADAASSHGRFALINAGGGWPNKRWAPSRFGELAARLSREHGLRPLVLWGRGEESLAADVVGHSEGTAEVLPPTDLGDVLALASRAALVVSGDTGPLHLAAAIGAPIVGIYGPTWPERNGPWAADDVTVSRAACCMCHHKRRCQQPRPCLEDVSVEEVAAAAASRLRTAEARHVR